MALGNEYHSERVLMKIKPHHGMIVVLTVAGVAYVLYKAYKWSQTPWGGVCNNYQLPKCLGVTNPNSNCWSCNS